MKAVLIRSFGGSDVLELDDVETPRPGVAEAVVKVGAVGVARTRDIATRTGRHPFSRQVKLPHVLGGDFAGVVADVGPGVDRQLIGRRVGVMSAVFCGTCTACLAGMQHECIRMELIGIHRWGSYAEYTVVPADNLYEIPDDVDMVQAAAMAATGTIALMQVREANIGAGDRVLVTGVTGALASVLAVLIPTLGGSVIGLSRRPEATTSMLNATVLDANRPDLSEAIVTAADGGPHAVIDNVSSPDVFDHYFPVLRNGARIVVSGAIGTPDLPVLRVPAASMYIRSIALIGVRSADLRAIRDFWQLVLDGFRIPANLLHATPLADAANTHDRIINGNATGNNVLTVDPTL